MSLNLTSLKLLCSEQESNHTSLERHERESIMIILSVLGELILNHNFLHCMEKTSIMNVQQNIYVCILPKKVRHKCE